MASDAAKPRASIPDPRSSAFRKPDQFDKARAAAKPDQENDDKKLNDIPGFKTGNLAAIDAAQTASINELAQKDREVPFAHLAENPVYSQTDPNAEGEIGGQKVVHQETQPNPVASDPYAHSAA